METKERILVASEEAWLASGGIAPSVREIAGRAEANIALISYYFNNSKGLVEATVAYVATRLRTNMGIGERSIDKQLFNIIENWIDIVSMDRGIRFFVYGPHFANHPRVVAARSAAENEVRNAAAEAISVMSDARITSEDVVDVVFGPVLYNLLNWGEGMTADALRARVFNHLLRMGLSREEVVKIANQPNAQIVTETAEQKPLTEDTIPKPQKKPKVSTPKPKKKPRK